MAEKAQEFFTYKGLPLVRYKNYIYFGNPSDSHIIFITILSTDANDVPTKVSVELLLTDESKPPMERLLKKIEKSKLSEDEKLIVKWTFATDNYRYFYRNRAYKKAIDILENFTKESGGEKRLERIDLLFSVYSYKADCLLKLDKTEEGIKYKQKALLSTDDSRAQHVLYLDLATIEINRKNFSSACEYILKASEKSTSQKGYFCLALVHLKQGRKEEAKKYYSLALTCKKFPVVLEEDLTNLKKKLFQ